MATATTIKQTKSERTREKLLAAAAKVVGKYGYAKASVTRITMEAGIASGGFYYYFDTREEMFDELLPGLGREMLAFIADRVGGLGWGLELETLGFQAYLEYLRVRPEFYRVFGEAYVYARRAYNKHMATVIEGYVKVLRRQKARGFITKAVADEDVPLLAHFLIGIRAYVSQFYMERDRKMAADVRAAVDLYRKMIAGRVFTEGGK